MLVSRRRLAHATQRGSGFVTVERTYVRGQITTTKNKRPRRIDLSTWLRDVRKAEYRERYERVVAIDAEAQASLDALRDRSLDDWIFPEQSGGPTFHSIRAVGR